jgi:phage terminase small subunit
MPLTVKQEAFAQSYIENGGNKSAAYREAYDAENMQENTINVKACELFKNGKVAVRVLELQSEHRERHNVTVDSLTKELDEARGLAKEEAQPAAMTGATMGKAKLHGLITDKSKTDLTSGGKPIKNEWHVYPVTNNKNGKD